MNPLTTDILPRFLVLFPIATQKAQTFEAHVDDVTAWIAKAEEGRWRSIGVEYADNKKDVSMVLAALDWLGMSAGIPKSVIDDVRDRSPEDKTTDERLIDGIVLRAIFSVGTVCVRVDRQ